MRLVCDKCSSIYTIEDNLVGGRDFRVGCKQCGTPIVVRGARQVSSLPPPSSTALRASAPPPAKLPSTNFAPHGGETWFVSLDQQQQGPYSAVELARLLEQERITWATPVWREGMKAWRPARRDAVLVTAVAGARGYAGDTMRLSASRSFLAPEDTVVDLVPELPHEPLAAAAGAEDLSSSASETKVLDARKLPDLRPSERPAAWNSPENQAFRARLGLPDSREVRSPAGERVEAASRTLADAFRSAPTLMTHSGSPESTAEMPIPTRPTPQDGWVPRAQSFWAVAGLAFAGGVLAAALYARFAVPEAAAPPTNLAAPPAPPVAAPKKAPEPVPARPPAPPTPTPQAVGPTRELPEPDELRAAVRSVAADVRRCVLDPAQGVDVDIYLDGPSGRVRDVDVRSPELPPGRVECVTHAVRKLQLSPFMRPELKLMHKFSW